MFKVNAAIEVVRGDEAHFVCAVDIDQPRIGTLAWWGGQLLKAENPKEQNLIDELKDEVSRAFNGIPVVKEFRGFPAHMSNRILLKIARGSISTETGNVRNVAPSSWLSREECEKLRELFQGKRWEVEERNLRSICDMMWWIDHESDVQQTARLVFWITRNK